MAGQFRRRAVSAGPIALDLDDIQGTILRGYRMPAASHVFLTFLDAGAARAWVASVVEPVTSAAPWEARPAHALNVGFSAAGLHALEVPDAVLATFPTAFTQGMAARAELLGDVGANSPTSWQGGLGTEQMHAVVMISAQSEELLAERLRWLAGTMSEGITELYRQDSAVLPGAREHFGFADGFAQPDVAGLETGPRHGLGVYSGRGRWRPIRAGEFVLGYPDEAGVVAGAALPAVLGRNGSYLVVRKLEQDVDGFRRQLTDLAASTGLDQDLIAAKMVGRWPDGTPVGRPRPADAAEVEAPLNDFDYSDDPGGHGCPVGAHIPGVTEQTRQESAVLSGAREHFGFADGFAQPDVEGLDTGPRHALGVYAGGGRWRPIRAGEFVLGYLDEAGVVAGAGLPDELGAMAATWSCASSSRTWADSPATDRALRQHRPGARSDRREDGRQVARRHPCGPATRNRRLRSRHPHERLRLLR